MVAVLKTVGGESRPWVRILLPTPAPKGVFATWHIYSVVFISFLNCACDLLSRTVQCSLEFFKTVASPCKYRAWLSSERVYRCGDTARREEDGVST